MLGDKNVLTNVAVKDLEEAKKFYGETLGLKMVHDTEGMGIMYSSGPNEGKLFVYQAPTAGTGQATICTWEVDDIKAVTEKLSAAGCRFENYEFPGAEHDGPVHIMSGIKAAWFRDPSGNILGLSQMG